MFQLLRYLKPYWWLVVLLVLVIYAQVAANLQLPSYMAKIVDEGIITQNQVVIYQFGGSMLLVALAGGIAAIGSSFLASRIATGLARDVRSEVFKKVESFSVAEFDAFSTASLITRTTNDIQQVQSVLVMVLRIVLMAPLMVIGALQNALQSAPEMSWIIALAVVLLLVVVTLLFSIAVPRFTILQTLVDKLNLVTRENLTGLRVVRAFVNEPVQERKFDNVNTDLMKLNLFVNRLMIILQPFMTLLMNVALVAIVWFGAQLVSSATIEVGSMMAFMQYATHVIMSFLMISIIFIAIPRAAVSARRIMEVLQKSPSIQEPEHPQTIAKGGGGRVEFKDVTFTYPGASDPVLSNITFTAEPGKTTALIGGTGSGKSTLLSLIPRFYDVTSGEVLIDGVDVRKLSFEDLYSQIGFVPQKATLFSGTVQSNVSYGNSRASTDDVQNALRIAQAESFVANLEGGVEGDIAQGGSNVSGGQKQRLSIARALAVKPNVYIFDDSFSALDFSTAAKLKTALADETTGKTVLMVGQGISTIRGADKIIVLDKGRVADEGTHEELMQRSTIYQEIARSQLSDAELSTGGSNE